MRELSRILKEASKAYYSEDREIMSNFEYDRLYDELAALEEKTGIVLSGSPTVTVGYEAVESLPKVRHDSPMLSLAKTKSREELRDWLSGHDGLLSWKLDGLTVVITYDAGKLARAVTRGNGEIGELITQNAMCFFNIPYTIPHKKQLVLRGEAVISYTDFNNINDLIPESEGRYKNPRNLCSGSVRQLDSRITAERRVRFMAFSLVSAEGVDFENSREKQFLFLREMGFDVVPYVRVNEENIMDVISDYESKVAKYEIPSDGLVLTYDDIAYGESLGRTSKFPRNSIAFKWQDETAETVLRSIEWNTSRTGLINPVAVFDPVELEGTTVTRASVHNLSIIEELKLGIGDRVRVYKANMIIPQISEDLDKGDNIKIPHACPSCGSDTQVKQVKEGRFLECTNPECPARKIKSFVLFVTRDAMNIEGLSEMTLEKLAGLGMIRTFADIYRLGRYRDRIETMEGFGRKSCDNLLSNIERSRDTTADRVLYSIGIPGVGLSVSRLLLKQFGDDLDRIRSADEEELAATDGVGEVLAGNVAGFFRDEKNNREFDDLLSQLRISRRDIAVSGDLEGKTFVITGSLNYFKSRSDLKNILEGRGAKVAGSVSKNTDCLINNDSTSTSSKNKKAGELGIPVLTEEEFLDKYGIEH
ncbi:MAG: NAD-dependent DNA ligase LigA [Lachnospiraceae bacterium]|nr:NAD-dependent DNA ligase LigA [Lachnospiraceae bacterium]